jgi:hypothetical protein
MSTTTVTARFRCGPTSALPLRINSASANIGITTAPRIAWYF